MSATVVAPPAPLNLLCHQVEVSNSLRPCLFYAQTLNEDLRLMLSKDLLNFSRHPVAVCEILPSPMPAPSPLYPYSRFIFFLSIFLRLLDQSKITICDRVAISVDLGEGRHLYVIRSIS
jgi:hypothetical protein